MFSAQSVLDLKEGKAPRDWAEAPKVPYLGKTEPFHYAALRCWVAKAIRHEDAENKSQRESIRKAILAPHQSKHIL